MSLPPHSIEDIALPPCYAEVITLPSSLALDITLPSCSAEDIVIPSCSAEDIVPSLCHAPYVWLLLMLHSPNGFALVIARLLYFALNMAPPLSHAEEVTPPDRLKNIMLPSCDAKGMAFRKLCGYWGLYLQMDFVYDCL